MNNNYVKNYHPRRQFYEIKQNVSYQYLHKLELRNIFLNIQVVSIDNQETGSDTNSVDKILQYYR